MQIRNQKDFWAGVMFVAFGVFFFAYSTRYELGSAAKMGPAYFPMILGALLSLLGVAIALGSVSAKAASASLQKFSWPALFLVLGPVALFGLLLRPFGLVVCLLMLVTISSFASHEHSWRATLGNALALTTLSLVVFVWALKLQFPLWPAFMN